HLPDERRASGADLPASPARAHAAGVEVPERGGIEQARQRGEPDRRVAAGVFQQILIQRILLLRVEQSTGAWRVRRQVEGCAYTSRVVSNAFRTAGPPA